jgi:antitoxin (DNA-binding transcriptional repressor) of toxin-antitoxin stability system
MEPLHISEGDLARDVRSILQRVETGGEVIIERDAQPVAVIRPAEPVRRKISECIALMPADSTATIDPGSRHRRTPGQERPPTARNRGAGNRRRYGGR